MVHSNMTGEQYISELLSKYSSLTWSISLVSNMNDCFLIHANSAQKKKKNFNIPKKEIRASRLLYNVHATIDHIFCNLLHMLQLTTYVATYYICNMK